MPTFQIAGEGVEIASKEDLLDLLDVLSGQGWLGTVGVARGHAGDAADLVWSMNVFTTNADGSQQSMTADIGDMKVTIGSAVTVMTPSVYDATYGA